MDEYCVIVDKYGSSHCRTSVSCALVGDLERFALRAHPVGSFLSKEFQQQQDVFFIGKGPRSTIQYHRSRIIKGQGSFRNDTTAKTFLARGFPNQGISQGCFVDISDPKQCEDFIPPAIAIEQTQLNGLTPVKTALKCFDFVTFRRGRAPGLSLRCFEGVLHGRTLCGIAHLTTRAHHTIAIDRHGHQGVEYT